MATLTVGSFEFLMKRFTKAFIEVSHRCCARCPGYLYKIQTSTYQLIIKGFIKKNLTNHKWEQRICMKFDRE